MQKKQETDDNVFWIASVAHTAAEYCPYAPSRAINEDPLDAPALIYRNF